MTFSKKSLLAAQDNKTQVVPSVNQYRDNELSRANFPYPAKHQCGYGGQKHHDRALVQCVHGAKDNGDQYIGQAQVSKFFLEFVREPILQSKTENCFFQNWRGKQQGDQSGWCASHVSKAQTVLNHQPSSYWATAECQYKATDFGNARWIKALGHYAQMIAVTLMLSALAPAFAGLGENESSINADRVRMHASRSVVVNPQYSVHDLQGTDGSKVRQYLSINGIVFAVTWHTLYKPNLSSILGTSYPAYATAAQEAAHRPGIQHHFRHESLDVVVQSSSHMNVFSGFAFRRSMLPLGFSPERIGLE